MRKLILILCLSPILAFARPPMPGEPPCGHLHPPKPPMGADGEAGLPPFLEKLDLSSQQKTGIQVLLKARHGEFAGKFAEVQKLEAEIRRLSFFKDYSEDRVQTLSNKAAVLHGELMVQHSRLDNAIFKLLNVDQQEKLQDQLSREGDCLR